MRQLFIDSRDRISGTSSNFRIQLPETLVLPPGRRARIDNLRVPQVFPTIQKDTNDTLVVNNGAVRTVTIAKGNYNGAGLAAAIQAALTQQAGGTCSCTYDAANIAMTLTCLSSPFLINGGTFAARPLSNSHTQTNNQYVFPM